MPDCNGEFHLAVRVEMIAMLFLLLNSDALDFWPRWMGEGCPRVDVQERVKSYIRICIISHTERVFHRA